jgi:hypothetical protein
MRALFLLAALAAAVLAAPAGAQQPSTVRKPQAAVPASRPTWNELTPAQREALAPLEPEWNKLDRDRKRKWLEVAPKFHKLSPEGKQRMHARMAEFSKLTPEQRWTTRENFQRAYELPADRREALVEQYKALPPDKKKELKEQAQKKPAPERRPGTVGR